MFEDYICEGELQREKREGITFGEESDTFQLHGMHNVCIKCLALQVLVSDKCPQYDK